MTRIKDMTGQTFGRLTVIGYEGIKGGKAAWRCHCECGGRFVAIGAELRDGRRKSCGCLSREERSKRMQKDITGQAFGRLTAISVVGQDGRGQVVWLCRCECGEKVQAVATKLIQGRKQSCGCLVRERLVEVNRTHGMSGTPIYAVWTGAIGRCHNPNHAAYARYGKRGITVCPAWRASFDAFYEHVSQLQRFGEPGLELDRIDNDRGYAPGNVRWVTGKANSNNRSSSRPVTLRGQTKTLADWCEQLGLHYSTAAWRLRKGWSPERALTEAPDPMKSRAGRGLKST